MHKQIVVQFRGNGETSKGRGSQGKGRGRGAIHRSAQKAIAKKTTTGQGRGISLSELDFYVPSREAFESNSVSLSEEHNQE